MESKPPSTDSESVGAVSPPALAVDPQENFFNLRDRLFFSPKSQKILLWSCSLVGALFLIGPEINLPHLLHLKIRFAPAVWACTLPLLFLCSPLYAFLGAGPKWDKVRIDFRKWPSQKGFAVLAACVLIRWIFSFFWWLAAGNELLSSITQSLFFGLLFPLSGAAAMYVGKYLPRKETRSSLNLQKSSVVKSLTSDLLESCRTFLTQSYPYLTVPIGFFVFSLLVAFLPNGIGHGVAAWLTVSFYDANVHHNSQLGFVIPLLCSISVAALLIGGFSSLVVRLGAGYQSLLQKLAARNEGDNLFAIIFQSLKPRVLRVPLVSRHPHLRSAWETLKYLAICYFILFFLVGLLPLQSGVTPSDDIWGPVSGLAWSIRNWLCTCLRDAGFPNVPFTPDVRLFLASVIAANGLVPIAVMGCAFLPMRKEQNMFVSEQGILLPHTFGRKLQFWSELKTVSVTNPGVQKKETVCLKFKSKTIKVKTAELHNEQLAEILALADEYGTNCSFDSTAIVLRNRLSKESNSSSLAETKRFESTTFVPHLPGDFVKDGTLRIVRKLTSKPLSAVYLARMQGGGMAIVKQFVMPLNNEKALRQQETFQRECEILQGLAHPLLVKVIDSFEEARASYIVLERIEGTDLRELVKQRGARSEKTVIRWALDICEQLDYMHSKDPPILHRDLTPDNLMVDDAGRARIIDFGAAHQFLEGVTGTLIGKQSYIAPEQLRGKPTCASDLYSFGASLYYLLSGEDPKALKQCDLGEKNISASQDIVSLIKQCTSFEETDRPASIKEVKNVLLTLLGETREKKQQFNSQPRSEKSQTSTQTEVAELVEVESKGVKLNIAPDETELITLVSSADSTEYTKKKDGAGDG